MLLKQVDDRYIELATARGKKWQELREIGKVVAWQRHDAIVAESSGKFAAAVTAKLLAEQVVGAAVGTGELAPGSLVLWWLGASAGFLIDFDDAPD